MLKFRLFSLVLLTIVLCLVLVPALAGPYTDFTTAWKVLENDGVLEYASMGSSTFVDALMYVMKTKSTTKIGGDYYKYSNHASSCWGFGNDAGGYLAGIGAPGKDARVKGGDAPSLHGNNAFNYNDFIRAGVPQRGCSIIRTGTKDTVNSGNDNGGHTMLLLYYNETYVYYLDGNNASGSKQALWKMTWKEWTDKELKNKSGGRFIKYLVWNSDASFLKKYPDAGGKKDEAFIPGVFTPPAGTDYVIPLYKTRSKAGGSVSNISNIIQTIGFDERWIVKNFTTKKEEPWYKTSTGLWAQIDDTLFVKFHRQGDQSTTSVTWEKVVAIPITVKLKRDAGIRRFRDTPWNEGAILLTAEYANKSDYTWFNTAYTVEGIYKTSRGTYWLKLAGPAMMTNYWICADEVVFATQPNAPTISGPVTPANQNLKKGQSFTLKGKINSDSTMAQVTATVYNVNNAGIRLSEATKAYKNGNAPVIKNVSSVNLEGSAIDYGIKFGYLEKGNYELVYTVEYYVYKDTPLSAYTTAPFELCSVEVLNHCYFTIDGGIGDILEPTITNTPVTTITLNTSSRTMQIGEEYKLTANVQPTDATNKSLAWASSNVSVATVQDGKVTAVGNGTAIITATANDGSGIKATCTITVDTKIASITVKPVKNTLYLGETTTVDATVQPATAANCNITWSSNNDKVVTISNSGQIKAVGIGEASIVATAQDGSNVCGTVVIKVLGYVESIALQPTKHTVYTGKSVTVTPNIWPTNATNKNLVWKSSSTSVATVNNGVVTGHAPGTATITATAEDRGTISASMTVEVKQYVTSMTISGSNTVYAGKTTTLAVNVLPTNASNKAVTWSSENTSVATVDQNGVVTGKTVGNTRIVATAADGSGVVSYYNLTVKNAISAIAISGENVVAVNGTTSMNATITPTAAANEQIVWKSSNTSVATVNSQGIVTGVSAGKVTITAESADGSGVVSNSFELTVVKQKIAITINGAEVVYTGKSTQLTAVLTAAEALADNGVVWTSDHPEIATIDQNGVVTGVSNGTVTITATSREESFYKAQLTMMVKTLVENVTISGTNTIDEMDSVQLNCTVLPATANDKNVQWSSSDTNVAFVDATGKVTGITEGTIIITAAAMDGSGIKGIFTITVYPLVHSIQITADDVVYLGSTINVTAVALPENARNCQITWSSSDTTVATVDQNGVVTPVSNGVVTITATSKGNAVVSASVLIEVKTLVSAISISGPDKINVGRQGLFEVQILPETASNKSIIWTCNQTEYAEIDNDGNCIALAPGNVTITAVAQDGSGVIGVYDVEIFQPIQSVSVDVDTYFYQGQTMGLDCVIMPIDASEPWVKWESSDNSIIKIIQSEGDDSYYYAVAMKPGVAKLTATALDGSGKTDSAYVEVLPYVELNRSGLSYNVFVGGETSSKLGTVSLSMDTIARAAEDGYGVTWSIEHISGDYAANIGLNEKTYTYDGFKLANAADLMLLRTNKTGTDKYRVTCTIHGISAACDITITVKQPDIPLPDEVTIQQTTVYSTANETIQLDINPIIKPQTAQLPEGTTVRLEGEDGFYRFAQWSYAGNGVYDVMFTKSGMYTGKVIYAGANFEYVCEVQFVIANEEGTIAPPIQQLYFENSILHMLKDQTATFVTHVYPINADLSAIVWSSSDPDVATVDQQGVVTAVANGSTLITAATDNGITATGFVYVTDSLLTIDWNSSNVIKVYVEGNSRMDIQDIFLTSDASEHLTGEPVWTLKRVSGNNLTLTCKPTTSMDQNGHVLYGCTIVLKSVSSVGETEYELTCTDGEYSTTTTIRVNAETTDQILPSMVTWKQTVFTANVNELIMIYPQVQCWPESTRLPDEVIVSFQGDDYWNQALNLKDYTVSRTMSTFSFKEPGVYTAECVYACANMKYTVPVTIRIKDAQGNVPVRVSEVILNKKNLSLEAGTTYQLTAMISPADATNKVVTWYAEDESVATVDANGLVTAVADGWTNIYCIPDDTNARPVACEVVVEPSFTVTRFDEALIQYLQGDTGLAVAAFKLSAGTVDRLEATGEQPLWQLERVSGQCAEVELVMEEGTAYVTPKRFTASGTDVYRITCTAGANIWSDTVQLTVVDCGVEVPASISLAQNSYTAAVGEEITLDFTPVYAPAGTKLPNDIYVSYVGIGDFYDALMDEYLMDVLFTEEDTMRVAFKTPGTYLMNRYYHTSNLTFVTTASICVDDGKLNLLTCTDPEATVYIGGRSTIATSCVLTDVIAEELYANEIQWKAERLTGDCLTVALKANQSSASLYVVNAKDEGTETWRISCSFRGYTSSVDVMIHAVYPQYELPESIALYQNRFDGMSGQTIRVPLAVECSPADTALPENADAAWTFVTDSFGKDYADWKIEQNQLVIRFTESGYYGGRLIYESGNASYELPISFAITDEESVQDKPRNLAVILNKQNVTVYPEGETNVVLVQGALNSNGDGYNLESVGAYAEFAKAMWTIELLEGDACSLALQPVNAASVQIVLNSIAHSGDVKYRVNCMLDGQTYSNEGNIHVAADNESRPNAQLKQTVFTTPVGTVLVIDASFYDKVNHLMLCSGEYSIWDNQSALAAMGFSYQTSGDCWMPVFYEAGTYTTTVYTWIGNLKCEDTLKIRAYEDQVLPTDATWLKVPTALTKIDEEAFCSISANVVDLRGAHVQLIGSRAFANCNQLKRVYIPSSVTSIAADAFDGCDEAIFYCDTGSYAEAWATNHGYPVIH